MIHDNCTVEGCFIEGVAVEPFEASKPLVMKNVRATVNVSAAAIAKLRDEFAMAALTGLLTRRTAPVNGAS